MSDQATEIKIFKCDNCGISGIEGSNFRRLTETQELMTLVNERLDVGGIFTDLECLSCGALAYPVMEPKDLDVLFRWGDLDVIVSENQDAKYLVVRDTGSSPVMRLRVYPSNSPGLITAIEVDRSYFSLVKPVTL